MWGAAADPKVANLVTSSGCGLMKVWPALELSLAIFHALWAFKVRNGGQESDKKAFYISNRVYWCEWEPFLNFPFSYSFFFHQIDSLNEQMHEREHRGLAWFIFRALLQCSTLEAVANLPSWQEAPNFYSVANSEGIQSSLFCNTLSMLHAW